MADENGKARQYEIDLQGADGSRSMSALIAARRCYQCQQSLTEDMVLSSEPEEHIEQIVLQCSQTPDYLLPDTPIKEAIFRFILAGSNEPRTAAEISEELTERWSLSVYPRDVSPRVIERLLDHGESYSIVALPEPEEEAEEDGEEEPEPAAEDESEV